MQPQIIIDNVPGEPAVIRFLRNITDVTLAAHVPDDMTMLLYQLSGTASSLGRGEKPPTTPRATIAGLAVKPKTPSKI